ncbi:MAG: hypothetical protein OXT09_05385 [Myxococcales bacterium]|nr:hypothetical protein [Myxococcales bacterium]
MTALACAVCYAAKDDASQLAFLIMTGFMTGLPLLLLGAGIYWVVRRMRRLEEQERVAEAPAPTAD